MIEVKITSPIEISKIKLLRLGKDLAEAISPIISTLATAAKKRVQQNMGSYLGSRKGWLRKHIYSIRRSSTHYVVSAPRHIAEPLESGAFISSKKTKYLTFFGSSGFVKKHSVVIPARHWFTRSYDGFEESPEYEAAINKGIEKAIRKYGENAVWSK